MEEHERIELRSDDVQEIIGTPPRWIVRWGTLIISAAILSLVSMSFFVKYPDKVYGKVQITSMVAPARIKVPMSGNIHDIFIANGKEVVEGELLIAMQNAANHLDVLDLDEEIKTIQNNSKEELLTFDPTTIGPFELGNLQQFYSQFITAFDDFQYSEVIQAGTKEVSSIRNQMKTIDEGIIIDRRNLKVAKDNAKIEYKQYQRIRNLEKEGEASLQDVENQRKIHNNALTRIKEIEANINRQMLQKSQLSTQIETITNTENITNNDKFVKVQSSMNNLISAIGNWKEQNLITSPMDGTISMTNNYSEKQYVNQGDEIMAILPMDAQDSMFIKLSIPIMGSGKVKEGQRVLLKFDNYPHKEYGKVDGIVVGKSGLPRDGALQIEINLPNKLVTRMGKQLDFEQEMQGDGEIITEDRSVFVRIFENIIDPFNG